MDGTKATSNIPHLTHKIHIRFDHFNIQHSALLKFLCIVNAYFKVYWINNSTALFIGFSTQKHATICVDFTWFENTHMLLNQYIHVALAQLDCWKGHYELRESASRITLGSVYKWLHHLRREGVWKRLRGRGCWAKDDVTFLKWFQGKISNNLILKSWFYYKKIS